ncbi:MAG: universal stress protein [Candidatus Ancillula sp.]|jgi:phosphopantothenate-cysteine ligase|nr:universal stress protein [Candidatus Ancillula sp.]
MLNSEEFKYSPSILITSGGTREMIDQARMITNRSTGKLGSLIADVFIARGAKVTYLYANHAIQPNFQPEELIRIKTSSELKDTIDKLLCKKKFDAVIHLMAVSDFTPSGFASKEEVEKAVKAGKSIDSVVQPLAKGKMSSKLQDLVLFFDNTEKVIDIIKDHQPDTILVGFKLLADAEEGKLKSAAHYVLEHSNCDYVVANDQKDISFSQNKHKAFIMNRQGEITNLDSKEQIAIGIAKIICHDLRNR